ncbi:MAG: cupredoxin domain-containing protein, partial [Nitrosomonas sp.]|nr:cupredoxin domain-containing protein [Nitrosomonas sp.]
MEEHMKKTLIVFLMLSCLGPVGAYATTNRSHAAIGEPGVQENVTRTIRLEAYEYRFSPSEINIKQDETIRFIVKNTGKKKHEMMIDTMQHLREHEKMMRQHDHGAYT